MLSALPAPTGPPVNPSCDNVSIPCRARLADAYSNPTSFDALSLRWDQAVKRGLTLFARGAHTPSAIEQRSFSSVTTSSRTTDLVTAVATAVLGSTMFNDLWVGWGRSTGRVTTRLEEAYGAKAPPHSVLFPAGRTSEDYQVSLTFPDATTITLGTRVSNRASQLNIVDTFSLVAGRHHIRTGVDFRRFEPTNRGTTLHGLVLENFAQLRSGTMGSVRSLASEPITARLYNWSTFAQDAWQATDALTLTYGLRWEVNSPPVSITPGKPLYAIEGIFDDKPLQLAPAGTPLWRTRYTDLAPRAGAAWQVASGTMVRGGGGRLHDLGYGRLLGGLIFGFPHNRNRIVSVAGQPYDLTNPVFGPLPVTTDLGTVTQGNLAAFDPDLRLPATWSWNAAVEQQLGGYHSLQVTYLGADGRRLLRPDFVVRPESRPLNLPAVATTRNAGRSRYDALQVQWQRRLHDGLQALASYTWASARDTESDDGGGNFLGAALNANYAGSLSEVYVPNLARADFDIRHNFSAAVSYALPPPFQAGLGHILLKDWAVDAIVRASSAPPLNVRIEGVSRELGAYRTQPDLVANQPLWLDAPDHPGGRVLNPDAFTLPAPGAPGDFPRNSIRSLFPTNQTDVALRRRFALTSGVSLEFRAEFFNVFNHPMFGGASSPATFWGRCTTTPCAGQQSPFFGRVQGVTLNEGLGGDPLDGGQSAIYALGGPRSGQFSLKLRF
jgi:hypothetical protein